MRNSIIVIYRTRPASEIRDLWRVRVPIYESKKWGRLAPLRLVTRLPKPLTLKQLKGDRLTRDLPVVRAGFQGKRDITEDWSVLYSKVTEFNPHSKAALRDYSPD